MCRCYLPAICNVRTACLQANIGLDTLDSSKFEALTGSHDLNQVISGIDAVGETIDFALTKENHD